MAEKEKATRKRKAASDAKPARKEKKEKDGDDVKTRSKASKAGKAAPKAAKATKASKEAKPKKKKEKAGPKEKPPVDVEKQCGVPLPNGDLCARSLTCKSHSMGAKRAVQGRSQPYDVLLASYQKKNQVKLATLSAQMQLDEENEAFKDEVVDDNEEFAQVMAGVQRSYPVPVEQKVVMPVRLKNDFFRMREMLIGTLTNVASVPPPTGNPTSSASQIMSATGAVLGRTIVYEPATGNSFVRPSRAVRRR